MLHIIKSDDELQTLCLNIGLKRSFYDDTPDYLEVVSRIWKEEKMRRSISTKFYRIT